MDYAVVILVSGLAAGLTLFSGFGLGSLLLPAFAVFFPVEVAVAATAVVHLANNMFKLALVGRDADQRVVVRFGVPALIGAIAGAVVLVMIGDLGVIARYGLWGKACAVTPVKLVVGLMVAGFAVFDFLPIAKKWAFGEKHLPVGGALSGFFGGLSGHQGALRSVFLVKAGLDKRAYVGTASVCSALVDVARLVVYFVPLAVVGGAFGKDFAAGMTRDAIGLVIAGCVAAFAGSFVGARLLKKVTLEGVHVIVGVMLVVVGLAMAVGVI
ncbi:MAG: TSUP family transporter [Phycisphaerales bacterium]